MADAKDLIDTVCVLNTDEDVSTIAAMDLVINEDNINQESFIVSDADHELLILISFRKIINLKSVKMYSLAQPAQRVDMHDISAPKRIHVYKISNLSISFEDLLSMQPDQTITCNPKNLTRKGQIIPLQKSSKNAIKFKKTKYLAIYIDSNENDTETTLLNAITIQTDAGTPGNTTKSISQSVSILGSQNKNENLVRSLCKSVSIEDGCDQVDNVLHCLCFYQSLDLENDAAHRDEMMKKMEVEYKTFLDDYIHMLLKHDHEIEKIHNTIVSMSNMKPCALSHCALAMRHHRNREKASSYSHELLSKEVMFWREVMDACHCYVYHLYDVGLRIKMDDTTSHHAPDTSGHQPYFDAHLATICTKMKTIKTNLNKLKQFTFSRYQHNKFALNGDGINNTNQTDVTFMDGLYQYMLEYMDNERVLRIKNVFETEEYDTESIEMDMETDQHSNATQWFDDHHYLMHSMYDIYQNYLNELQLAAASFKIGYMFYYWIYYEDQYPELYIKSKYKSLKEEIRNNTICQLTTDQLNASIQKAHQFIDTAQAKEITALRHWTHYYDIDNRYIFKYNVKMGTPLSVEHVLSVLLYTDWSKLSKEFSATFRSITPFETLSSVKNRNREFAVWSKLLRETVEYFGNLGDHRKKADSLEHAWKDLPMETGPFYCGLSRVVVIPEFNIRLIAPTSTTKQIEVAQRFASENGIIIQLNNNGDMESYLLPSWNCSWLSTFSGEDERLWMGGHYRMKIETVRIMTTAKTYNRYLSSLFYFDRMVTNVAAASAYDDCHPTNTDYLILCDLSRYKMKQDNYGTHPQYILKTFEAYTKHKTHIVINLHFLDFYCPKLSHLITHKLKQKEIRGKKQLEYNMNGQTNTNILKPVIFKIFDNAQTLIICTTCSYANGTGEYPIDLLSLLSLLINASNVSAVAIHAMHQYKAQSDQYNTVTQQQHVGISWLGLVWMMYSTVLTRKYALKGWDILLKTRIEKLRSGDVFKDCLFITRHKQYNSNSSAYGLSVYQ
eukprot:51372_1